MSSSKATPRMVAGLTLVELLITTSLMVLVGGAIVAVLSGGLKVWQRARTYGTHEQAALIACAGLRRDLSNARRFSLTPFKGRYDAVEFPAAGRESADPDAPQEIGRMGYFLDDQRHLLCRSFAPYRLTERVRLRDRCQVVLEGVQRVRFEYFGAQAQTGLSDWSGGWEVKELPVAIKASVVMKESGQSPTSHTFVVYLPHSIAEERGDEPST